MASTIRAGVVAGSKPVSTRVGAPASPARTEARQKLFTPVRWATTSLTVHASQRLADRHSSSVRSTSMASNRRRWRMTGTR